MGSRLAHHLAGNAHAWAAVLVALSLAASLMLAAVVGTPIGYSLRDGLLLAGGYLALAVGLEATARALHRMAWLLGLLASLGIGVVLGLHFRQQLHTGSSTTTLVLQALLIGAVHAGVTRRSLPRTPALRLWAGAGLAWALLATLLWAAPAAPSFRSHLLRRNYLLGMAAYYGFGESATALRDAALAHPIERQAAPPAPVPQLDVAARRDIVMLVLDTLRADRLAGHGGAPDGMPNLNALAATATRFDDVLANSSWTRPSVGSFFTGELQEVHGAHSFARKIDPSLPTLAERLQQRGYETWAFQANPHQAGNGSGFGRGFDRFDELEGDGTYATAPRVLDALRTAFATRPRGHGPLFLYMQFMDAHSPHGHSSQGTRFEAVGGGPEARYAADVRLLDHHLGLLFEQLEASLHDPVIVVTSDHGEGLGDHDCMGHGDTLYAELVHIPLLVRTGSEPGQVIADRLEGRDLFHLVQHLADVPNPSLGRWAASHRRSQRYTATYTRGPSQPHHPERHMHYARALESDGLYVIWSAYGDTLEVYDAVRDRRQRRNIVEQHAARARELATQMFEDHPLVRTLPPEQVSDSELQKLRALGYVE